MAHKYMQMPRLNEQGYIHFFCEPEKEADATFQRICEIVVFGKDNADNVPL